MALKRYWAVAFLGVWLGMESGMAASEFREEFAGTVPAAGVWAPVILNDGKVTIEEMNGRRWARFTARFGAARARAGIASRLQTPSGGYTLSFRFFQKPEEQNGYGVTIAHAGVWQADVMPDGKAYFYTTDKDGARQKWECPCPPGQEYVFEAQIEPARARLSIKTAGGQGVGESAWMPRGEAAGPTDLSFGASARRGVVSCLVSDIHLTGALLSAPPAAVAAAPKPAVAAAPDPAAPASAGASAAPPPPAPRDPASLVEISNGKLKIVFDKASLALAGGVRLETGAPLIADPSGAATPMWGIEFAQDGGKGEKTMLDSLAPAQRGFEATNADGGAQARLTWTGLSLPGAEKSVDVTVTVDLPAGSSQSFWRIAAQSRAEKWGMWRTRFPVINVARPSRDPAASISLLQPYRYGALRPDVFAAPKLEARYPFAMMHMQFQALLGDWGVYLAAHDPACAYKDFELYPERSARTHARFELIVDPPGRGGLCQRYEAPFPFVLGVFDGDWFDAAQEYRKWAVNQPWCAKGPLAKRKDVPDWLKETGLVLKNGCMEYAGERPKGVEEVRPLSANVAAIEKLLDAFGGPIATIWYGWYIHNADKTAAPEGMTEINFGQFVETVTGMPEALRALRRRGFRPFAYVQSVIYDQGKTLDDDAKAMRAFAIKTLAGDEALYNAKSLPCWCMCHATEGWRKRLVELARRAVGPHGFQAVYLDSFGRSSGECFNPSHGHDLGGGFYRSAATHEIGKRVRDAMKAIDPDAALSAESAVETHIDIVDMNLLSYCAFPNCVPLWHAVYHDYSITYGRSIGSDNLLVDGGQLFVIGAQIGRVYARDNPPSVLKPGNEAVQKYLAQLLKLRRECGDFLVLGRMLRPARLPADLPRVTTGTAVKNVSLPVILTSSWQSPDGRAAVVLLNLGDAREFTFECDLAEYGFSPGVGLGVTRRTDAGVTPAGKATAGQFSRVERLEARQAVIYEFAREK